MDKLDDLGFDKEKEWQPDDDGYWNEEQWEKFLEENERLVDKYSKVMQEEGSFEKYKHPLDLYYKVHYDLEPMNLCKSRECNKCDDKDDCEQYYLENVADMEKETISEEERGTIEAEHEEDRRKLEAIPCYQSALKFDSSVKKFLKRFNLDKEWEDSSNIFVQLSTNAFKIHANILSGHCFGYEDDMLCANIVKCKWAIKNFEMAMKILEDLKEKYPNYSEEITRLKEEARSVEKDMASWIETLRSKVWWA